MIHIQEAGPPTPHLPRYRLATPMRLVASAAIHVAALFGVVVLMQPTVVVRLAPTTKPSTVIIEPESIEINHLVFLVSESTRPGTGGGGGGNRQTAPIRRAQGVGSDPVTLGVTSTPPRAEVPITMDSPAAPALDTPRWTPIVLDAVSLASGTFEQTGLPGLGPTTGTSTGPGSGGGVGTGRGTGIGSGTGPGFGPGSGGGTGGGAYRPGGAVTAPRVLLDVKPAYTDDAVQRNVQGTVLLELVVTSEGRPSKIRVVRSLDPGGLDQAAMNAAERWRFEPGRLNGTPVDVLVTLMIDFRIW